MRTVHIYRPKRSALIKALLVFNFVALGSFTLGAFYVSDVIIRQAVSTPTLEYLACLVFPVAFMVAMVCWGNGTLDTLTSRFRVSITDDTLRFEYLGRLFPKRKEIRMDRIEDVEITGNSNIGVWITLRTKKGCHRIGHLLEPDDAFQIAEEIKAKRRADN